ncbi:spore germination protein (amino acid permease) [Paenibacillus sp. 1_12]|uniref:GerAB/ArcD/ProY family transporter n=1 Tax=Paenibacillus sp. 1_12 TaxID=1566278 RepID=UPI0008EF3A2E|nr:endospore germination permease [Paenibacillus sp. 1_12]SFM28760.1 spore germination protein (amino acid permease) [Paenibacillus sp. 1_12]
MKKYAHNEITLMQFICILSGAQMSVGLLALPQLLAQRAGTDGWIGLFIVWMINVAANLIVVQVMKKYPDGTILDLLAHYCGPWAGRTGAVILALYFFLYGYVGITRTILYIKQWLLQQTSAFKIMCLLLIPTYTIALNGFRIIGRYAELVFFISMWIPFAYLLTLKDAQWLYLLPVLKEGWLPVFNAAEATLLSFSGTGITLILYPFLLHKRQAAVGVAISNTMSMLVFLLITLICFVYFNPNEIKEYNEPVVSVLKNIEFKFIERIEVVFISFYIFMFSLSWIPTFYTFAFCTSWLLNMEDHRNSLRVLCFLLAFGTFLIMPTFNQNGIMEGWLAKFAIGVEYTAPVSLLMYIWFRKKKIKLSSEK